MEICEIFKEALKEEDESKRSTLICVVCRKLSKVMPFQTFFSVIQQKPNIIKYLLIASQLYESTVLLLFYALQDRFILKVLLDVQLIKSVMQNLLYLIVYCKAVNINDNKLRYFLLNNSKEVILKLQQNYIDDQEICNLINNFYKSFIKYNSDFELLNQCFQSAIQIRNNWPLLKDTDKLFELEIEDSLYALSQITSSKNIDQMSERIKQKREEIQNQENILTNKQLKQQMLEEWLFQPSEVPLLVANNASIDQLSSEIFKSNYILDLLLSFLLFPTKNPQIIPNKLYNVDVDIECPLPPSFRSLNVFVPNEQRPLIQFRAFRTMQVLTDNRNHFLLTKANQEYYQRVYSLIYECLKSDLVAITICPEIIVQLLSFLLYQESEISVYFLIYFNIPFRLILFFDIPEISQYFTQLISMIQTPYYKFSTQANLLLWNYFKITKFFDDLLQLTLYDQNTIDNIISEKSNEYYRPKEFEEQLLKKPDFQVLEVEKQYPEVEKKQTAEEIDNISYDIDQICNYLPGKGKKTLQLLQRMVGQAKKKNQSKAKQRMTMSQNSPSILEIHNLRTEATHHIFSPTRRRTIIAPKLASILENNIKSSIQIHQIEQDFNSQFIQNSSTRSQLQALTNPKNLFGVINETINNPNIQTVTESKTKPMFQRILVKRPTQIIMLHHSRTLPYKRSSQLSSQINLTEASTKSRIQNSIIINKFKHIISASHANLDLDREFSIYPPELKDQQINDFEQIAFNEEFNNFSFKNENFTKGLLELFYDVFHMVYVNHQYILTNKNSIKEQSFYINILTGNNKSLFINIIAKNYLLKQKVNDESYNTSFIAGKIYNLLLQQDDNEYYCNLQQHLSLICKTLLTYLIYQKFTVKSSQLLESLTLILEISKNSFLNQIPVSFFHLLIESHSYYNGNQIYINLFTRIITICFLYGNLVIYNRLILKLNYLSYFKNDCFEIKFLFLILYTMIKYRKDDIKQLKKQIESLSSWEDLIIRYKKFIKEIDQGNIPTHGLKIDQITYISKLITQKLNKECLYYKP